MAQVTEARPPMFACLRCGAPIERWEIVGREPVRSLPCEHYMDPALWREVSEYGHAQELRLAQRQDAALAAEFHRAGLTDTEADGLRLAAVARDAGWKAPWRFDLEGAK